MPRERAGGPVPVGPRPRDGSRNGAGRGKSGGGARRSRGEEPVSGALVLHRGGRRALLRPRGGGRRALEKAARAEPPRGHRTLGGGQDVLRPRGRGGRAAGGLGRHRDDAGRLSVARARPGARPPPRERPGGAPRARGLRGRRDGLPASVALEEKSRRGPRRGRPVRGALHPQPSRDPGATRFASRQARERSGRPRPPLLPGRLPDALSRARGSRARLQGADAAPPDDARRAEEGAGRAGAEAGLPIRGRGARGRDGGRGRRGAHRPAAPGLCRFETVGETEARAEAPDARGIRRDRRRGRRSGPARRGNAGADRSRHGEDRPRASSGI